MQSTIWRIVSIAVVSGATTRASALRIQSLVPRSIHKKPPPLLNPNQPTLIDPTTSNMGWCRTAFIQNNGDVSTEAIADFYPTTLHPTPFRQVGAQILDLTQSPDWMEYLEIQENRQDDIGGAGAYDTMRCDIVLSDIGHAKERQKIWGLEYHIKRLQNSYLSILQPPNEEESEQGLHPLMDRSHFDKAVQQSKDIISALMAEAEETVKLQTSEKDVLVNLFRLTLLWSTPKELQIHEPSGNVFKDSILVRGHISGTGKAMQLYGTPDHIVVSVAAHTAGNYNVSNCTRGDLPTRYSNPQSKVASWCRMRKQMEQPETYKPPGVSEVLMVRPRLDERGMSRLEVLEGLSSNFIVVYNDGTVRTATEGVLHGYVRQLVLDCASKVGLNFDNQPVFLDEANQWQEAFITSSSRLIYPISHILLPSKEGVVASRQHGTLSPYWEDRSRTTDHAAPKWKELLNEILSIAGYENLRNSATPPIDKCRG